jgi:hypothetical protein
MRFWLAVVLCLAGVAHAQPEGEPAVPDPKQAQAESLFSEARKHYDLREYAEAIDAFKKAYALVPEPDFLFDIAQSYRQLRDCDNAVSFYRNYLRVKPDADNRELAEKRATEMDECAAEQRKQRDAERARQLATAPVVEGEPRYRSLRLAGIVTAGVGAAFAGAGVYFSIDAADKAHQLEQACMSSCKASDVTAIDSQGKSSQTLAVVTFATGGVALAAGAGMIVWATLHASPETITVTPTPGGATVSTLIRF